MARPRVEIVNLSGAQDPLHRMKNLALARHLTEFEFGPPAQDAAPPLAVLVRAALRADPPADLVTYLRRRQRETLVMMHLPDFLARHVDALKVFDRLIDVYLVGTPEMRDFVAGFTPRAVAVLPDPVDFLLAQAREPDARREPGPLRVMWFGYPESFTKSMSGYLPVLSAMVEAGEIAFHLVTRNDRYETVGFATVHPYDPATFTALASRFDVCVLSHQPFDFALPTWVKSENKAVLAIALGLPVAASRTPAYARLLEGLGLGAFLFSSQAELAAVLRRLADPEVRRAFLQASQPPVMQHYGAQRMAESWRTLMRTARERKFADSTLTGGTAGAVPPAA